MTLKPISTCGIELLEIVLIGDDKEIVTEDTDCKIAHNAFCKVKETLTRIGIREEQKLYQCCYILHKRGKYYLCHHSELKMLDDEQDVVLTVKQLGIRNKIAEILTNWNMVQTVGKPGIKALMSDIMVIPFRDIANFELISPYNIGVKNED